MELPDRHSARQAHDNKAFAVSAGDLGGTVAGSSGGGNGQPPRLVPKELEAAEAGGVRKPVTMAAAVAAPSAHGPALDHPTTYMESLTHLLRGNIGSGLMAMGDAFKNGGLLLGSLMTLFLGVVCVHNQHVLLKCSRRVKVLEQLDVDPDFAETVELSFRHGPQRLRPCAKHAKIIVNTFLVVTQLSFCCVYFVFASSSFKAIADAHGLVLDLHMHMFIILLPVMLPALVPNLKHLAPVSAVANVCMTLGIVFVFYYMFRDFKSSMVGERKLAGNWATLPLFFGTTVYSFEGIGLVLPLKNAMIDPNQFHRPLGVLNVGMTIVTTLLILFGFFGYSRWGEEVAGSLTLNLPQSEVLSELVKFSIGLCMVLTFALQFFIPIQIMWPWLQQRFGPFRSPTFAELMFRMSMVCLTFVVAQLVPHLNIIISLIGALCSTGLALFIPAIIELVLAYGTQKDGGPTAWVLGKNVFVIAMAFVVLVTGTVESLNLLVSVIRT